MVEKEKRHFDDVMEWKHMHNELSHMNHWYDVHLMDKQLVHWVILFVDHDPDISKVHLIDIENYN